MSLINFLSNVKNKRIQSQLKFIEGYKKVHDCTIQIMYHDNGLLIIDANRNICIIDIVVTV